MKKLKAAGILSGVVGVLGIIYIIVDKVFKSWHLEGIARSITIIGGADGPTSIFTAGKLGGPNILTYIFTVLAVLISIITWIIYLRKKGKK